MAEESNRLKAALALEDRSLGKDGEATLGAAYELLRDEWRTGTRDRELALHLAFLAWFLLEESAEATGIPDSVSVEELQTAFEEAHDFLLPSGAASMDAEALHGVGLMTTLSPFMLDQTNPERWEMRGKEYLARCNLLRPGGIDPVEFENRGRYGAYFQMHAMNKSS